MGKRLTKEEFIERARKVHENKYDYSKVEYVNNCTKVCIICPIHGEFFTLPCHFLRGNGCPKCGFEKTALKKTKNKEQFIEDAKKVHGDKYEYSEVKYKNNKTKVCIICPIHGEFWQTPSDHLKGSKCPQCAKIEKSIKRTLSLEEFIKKARVVHGNKYDYSKVRYIGYRSEVCIICPIHGEFWQTPESHLSGCGCQMCGKEKQKEKMKSNTMEYIEKAKKIHGNKYLYDRTEYINSHTKLFVRCRKHGLFSIMPYSHLNGVGCPHCNESKLENKIRQFLDVNNIEYIAQYRNKKILGKKSLDFYIPKCAIAIECQGGQHFKPINWFGGICKFNESLKRDREKLEECNNNNIKIYYYFEDEKYYGTYENEVHNIKELEKMLITS